MEYYFGEYGGPGSLNTNEGPMNLAECRLVPVTSPCSDLTHALSQRERERGASVAAVEWGDNVANRGGDGGGCLTRGEDIDTMAPRRVNGIGGGDSEDTDRGNGRSMVGVSLLELNILEWSSLNNKHEGIVTAIISWG